VSARLTGAVAVETAELLAGPAIAAASAPAPTTATPAVAAVRRRTAPDARSRVWVAPAKSAVLLEVVLVMGASVRAATGHKRRATCQLPESRQLLPEDVTGAAFVDWVVAAVLLLDVDVRLLGAVVATAVTACAATVAVPAAAPGASCAARAPAPTRASAPSEPVASCTCRRARSRSAAVLPAYVAVVPNGLGEFDVMPQLLAAHVDSAWTPAASLLSAGVGGSILPRIDPPD
jgi:hypothetical protein